MQIQKKRANRRIIPPSILALLLTFLIVFSFRFLVLDATVCTRDPDAAVAGLMARHLSTGSEFPVFFYGQAYMGSFEPCLNALMIRCLPESLHKHAASLGTTLAGIAFLFLIYLWARKTADWQAGIIAVWLSIFGSRDLSYFSVVPRGGYTMTLLLGLFLYLYTIWIACKERNHIPMRLLHYCFLGLIAGIVWWSNQLVIVYFLAMAIAWLVILRCQFWTV